MRSRRLGRQVKIVSVGEHPLGSIQMMKHSVRVSALMALVAAPVMTATLLATIRDTSAAPSSAASQAASQPAASQIGKAPWSHGLRSDPSYFPIGVWLQSPQNAQKYKAAGINLYIGLWQGPTEAQLAELKAAGMSVICEQNEVGLAHKADQTIVGWMHADEPDNAQAVKDPATGRDSWGGPVPPASIVANYQKLREADPTRPILLNLGQGVANDEWIGRGNGALPDDYLTYVRGGDIISFDVYPVADFKDGENRLWYLPRRAYFRCRSCY